MSGLFGFSVSEVPGAVAQPGDIDQTAIVLGCSSAGSNGLSQFYISGTAAKAVLGYGDGPDVLGQIIEQRQAGGRPGIKRATAFYKIPVATDGSYGTVDDSGVVGTCVPVAGSTDPYGTYEASVRVMDDGNAGAGTAVGTSGVVYQVSLSAGRPWSASYALGTATTIAIANSGVSFVLEPPNATLTALYAKLNDLKDKLSGTGHFVLTAGSVHASGDTTNDTTLSGIANATTPATAVTLFNAIKQYLGAHGANGTVHGTPDTSLATALAAIATATNVAEVDLRTGALVAAYEAHRVRQPSVHGAADSTYTVSSYTAAPGTLRTGDTWTVRTLAPEPDATGISDAFTAIANSSARFSVVVLAFTMTAALAANVTTGLNQLDTRGLPCLALCRAAIVDTEGGQTETQWVAARKSDFQNFVDSRIAVHAGYGLISDASTLPTPQYLRSTFAQCVADVMRVDLDVYMSSPSDQLTGEANVTLIDSSGALVGHDEGARGAVTGLSNDAQGARFISEQRIPQNSTAPEAVYLTFPWTMFGPTDTVNTVMRRRLVNSVKRALLNAAIPQAGGKFFYVPADENVAGSVPTLKPESRNAIHAALAQALTAYKGKIDNYDDLDVESGVVVVDPVVTVSAGGKIAVKIRVNLVVAGYLMDFDISIALKE